MRAFGVLEHQHLGLVLPLHRLGRPSRSGRGTWRSLALSQALRYSATTNGGNFQLDSSVTVLVVFSAGSIEGRLSSFPVVPKGVAKSSFQSSRWSKLCSLLFLVFFFLRSAKEDWLCRIALSRQRFESFVRAVLHPFFTSLCFS